MNSLKEGVRILELINLGWNVFLSNIKTLSKPYKITFAVTYSCNSRCKICGIWKRESKNELKKEEIKKFFKKNKIPWVNLTGGEVFLREDIVDIVSSMKGTYLLNLTTNGILTEKINRNCKKIKNLVPKFIVTVSIDGPRELHNELRGVNCWKNAVETYKKLRENKIECYIGYTISKYNIDEIKNTFNEIKKEIPELKMEDFHINFYHESDLYFNNKGETNKNKKYEKKLEKKLLDFIKIKKGLNPVSFIERKFLKLSGNYIKTGNCPLKCKSLNSSCFIDPKGNVYPCTIFNKKIGNIRETEYDLNKIWNSKKSKETRKEIKEGKCPGCWTPCEAYQTIMGNIL